METETEKSNPERIFTPPSLDLCAAAFSFLFFSALLRFCLSKHPRRGGEKKEKEKGLDRGRPQPWCHRFIFSKRREVSNHDSVLAGRLKFVKAQKREEVLNVPL